MSNSIFELTLIEGAIGLGLVPVAIFHIVFPFAIVNRAKFEIVMFSFALLLSIDPLAFVVVTIDILHYPCPVRDSIQFLPIVGVLEWESRCLGSLSGTSPSTCTFAP